MAVLVMLGGLGLTANLWRHAQQDEINRLQAEFKSAADQIVHNILSRISAYEVVMRGVKGYFEGSEFVSYDEFHQYVQALQIQTKTPGVQGIGLVMMVLNADKERHEDVIRKQGLPHYHIHPEGERERYAPIVYIEPMGGDNLKALGFDVLSVPDAQVAMERSRDSGDMAITSRITLVQDAGKSDVFAFVMYLPIYQHAAKLDTETSRHEAITAWVDVPFRINDLMAGLRGEFDPDIDFELHDGEPKSDLTRMYHSDDKLHQQRPRDGNLQTIRQVNIGGHQWTLLMSTTPAFEARIKSNDRPIQVAITGIALSLLISALLGLLSSRRNLAQARFKQLFELAGDGILVLTLDYRIVEANPSVLNMLGYTREELIQLQLPDILAPDEHPRLDHAFTQMIATQRHFGEWVHVRKNSTQFPVEVSAHLMTNQHLIAILRDLSERKKSEQRIQRLTQLYQALSETNQAIVRMDNGDDLFKMVCQCAVNYGGIKMAWIGQLDESQSLILPMAAHGEGLDYLDHLVIAASKATPEGCGPTGTALRENRPVIVNNYLLASNTHPWHALAKQFGWGSAAAFPIQRCGKPFAVFNLYHAQIDAFDKEAIKLLSEMAADVSFALDNFDRNTQRQVAEQALAESEAKLAAILEHVGAYIYLKDTEGRYLFANQRVLDLWETTLEDVVGFKDDKFFDAQTIAMLYEHDRQVLVYGKTLAAEETNVISKTGITRIYWSVKLPLHRADNTIYALCGISTDITERKQTEEALKKSRGQLETFIKQAPISIAMLDKSMNYLAISDKPKKISQALPYNLNSLN